MTAGSPFQLFDALDPATEAALTASIRRHGVIVPVIKDQHDRIIDGHHRARIATALGVPFRVQTYMVDNAQHAREIADTLNRDRRHLEPEQRRELVADLRADGHSLRSIAGALGTSLGQVQRDLGGVSIDTPETVVGSDGKRYPASRPVTERHAAVEHAASLLDEANDDGVSTADAIDEAEAIIATLEEEFGQDLDDEVIEQAVAENVESKRTPRIPTKPDLGGGISHPARFSPELLPVFAELLDGYDRVLDPFAGTGGIHALQGHGHETVGIEIEHEWASMHADTICGDCLDVMATMADCSFDAICTSPAYANRLADSHNASDPERRRSYTHDLGRKLTEGNAGAMQWGPEYRALHADTWMLAVDLLSPTGRFILNIKDHVRGGELQLVSLWHVAELASRGLGLNIELSRSVGTRTLDAGSNADARRIDELVLVFDRGQR